MDDLYALGYAMVLGNALSGPSGKRLLATREVYKAPPLVGLPLSAVTLACLIGSIYVGFKYLTWWHFGAFIALHMTLGDWFGRRDHRGMVWGAFVVGTALMVVTQILILLRS